MQLNSKLLKLVTVVAVCTMVALIIMGIENHGNLPAFKQILTQSAECKNRDSSTHQETLHENQVEKLKKQRNVLSKTLNSLLQVHGQLQCSQTKEGLAGTGGWCKNESGPPGTEGTTHITDMPLIEYLAKFYEGKRVGSFGDGPGMYKKHLDATGALRAYDAYDGAPFAPKVTEGRVKYLDLSVPQYGIPIYDWVMSLEVAEHIPKKYEESFLSNIARHAKTGVVLSWAVPDQGGFHHVNNQPLSYVINKMKQLGFERNNNMSLHIQSKCTLSWLKENTNVYLRLQNHPINENDA